MRIWQTGKPIAKLVLLAIGLAWVPTLALADNPTLRIATQPAEELTRPAPDAAIFSTKSLDQIRVDSNPPTGETPADQSTTVFDLGQPISLHSRGWMPAEYHWLAAEYIHQPLYFDDVVLERYGQSISPALQPLISGRRFFATIPLMPARLLVHHPYDPAYSYGYFRPGSPTPCIRQRIGR